MFQELDCCRRRKSRWARSLQSPEDRDGGLPDVVHHGSAEQHSLGVFFGGEALDQNDGGGRTATPALQHERVPQDIDILLLPRLMSPTKQQSRVESRQRLTEIDLDIYQL